jgi:outer membrane protein assembly factor BamB
VWHTGTRVELVCSGEKLITSLDPANGKELWRVAGVVGPGTCSFGADAERLYLGQSSPMDNPPLYALNAGGSGDLSPAAGSTELKSQAWSQKSASPGMASPVAADGLLYVATSNLLTCRDASTGEQLYKERVGELVTIMASPLAVGDKLLLLDEEGRAAFVQVGPEFQIVGKGKLDDLFWSTPSVAGDALFLRGSKSVYCVRK